MHVRWLLIASAAVVAACGGSPSVTPATVTALPVTASPPSFAVPPPTPVLKSPTVDSATLALDATGLGPCDEPWWATCDYGIRLEAAGGYDHRGTFSWDEGPRKGMAHGTAGPVASTGVVGDLPATLGPGSWTLSFRLYYGSDAVSFNPVPGGTPRYAWEDPFTAACSTEINTTGVVAVSVHVAFSGAKCKVVAAVSRG